MGYQLGSIFKWIFINNVQDMFLYKINVRNSKKKKLTKLYHVKLFIAMIKSAVHKVMKFIFV